jgi:hypothetical protein
MIDIFQLHMYIEDFFSSFILVTGKKSREEIDRSVYFTKPYILQRNKFYCRDWEKGQFILLQYFNDNNNLYVEDLHLYV